MRLKYLLLVLVLTYSVNGLCQISATADFFEATEYSDSDFVFVFCTDDINGGSLIANDSTGFGGYDFEWYKYNETTNDFTDLLTGSTLNNDSTSSTIQGLNNGGYKVVLTNVDKVQEYAAWVYINMELEVEIQFHPENGCDYLAMYANPYYANPQYFDTPFIYYNVFTGDSIVLQNKIDSYEWTSSPQLDSFNSRNSSFISIAEDAFDNDSELPTENTTFSVTLIDRFGCQVEDDIEYTAIETDADFSWTSFDNKTDETKSGNSDSELSGSAPLKVSFVNESLNGANYTWFFGDTLLKNDIDTIFTSNFLEEIEHTYYYSAPDSGKTYVLRLFSESDFGCTDSIFFNIKVEPSLIEFPNVFTPFSSIGQNDIFILTDYQSIRSFKITIFNRVGQVVHEFEGDVNDWQGWDGKVRTGNRKATPGNYFFVVEVLGWDNVRYDNNRQEKEPTAESDGNEGEDQAPPPGGTQFGVIRLF
jgi:gliding motility-associated-like protein